jgi:putative ABC transport system substrate-binding protein
VHESAHGVMLSVGKHGSERREFITLLGARAAATMPVVGFLGSRMASDSVSVVAAFHQSLKEIGYVEGKNVAIEDRWADNQQDRLPGLAADLLRRQPRS